MTHQKQSEVLGLSLQELTALVEASGQPSYRARQLFEALYRQRSPALQSISTLPLAFRRSLAQQGYTVGLPHIDRKFVSQDGTVRYLIAFADGQSVETVWMPEGDGGDEGATENGNEQAQGTLGPVSGHDSGRAAEPFIHERSWDRATICVSSQVGCAVNCQFCLTALLGVKRNLTAGEIVGQIIAVLNDQSVEIGSDRINLVFMGMGEPFLNYDHFMQAVRLLVEGVGIPESRMTVSTAGIVPRIEDFGREAVRPRLAISLNASSDEQRDLLMPINRKWNLEALLGAARAFPLRSRERLTFEYVLLDGVNDSAQNAREVVRLLQGIRAKVNLIALNPGPGIPFQTPSEQRVHDFQDVLMRAGLPTFVRRPRGRDIYAACGQLKRTVTASS